MLRIAFRSLCFVTSFWCLVLFVLACHGCGTVYRAVGLSPQVVQEQVAKDANSIVATVEQVRETAWPIINATIAGIATVISGYLGVALKKEKAISRTVITGVELAGDEETKDKIFLASTIANNTKNVDTRVQALTANIKLSDYAPEAKKE